jgi:hypothetical protein
MGLPITSSRINRADAGGLHERSLLACLLAFWIAFVGDRQKLSE